MMMIMIAIHNPQSTPPEPRHSANRLLGAVEPADCRSRNSVSRTNQRPAGAEDGFLDYITMVMTLIFVEYKEELVSRVLENVSVNSINVLAPK